MADDPYELVAQIRGTLEAFAVVGERLRSLFEGFSGFGEQLERLVANLPAIGNTVRRFAEYENCTRRDGIPIIWVPRSDIADAVLDAADRDARVAVLLEHAGEILEDCELGVNHIDGPELQTLGGFVKQALGSYAAGYPAAAQALGVVLCEQVITGLLGKANFKAQRQRVDGMGELPIAYMRSILCLWPVSQFYQTWLPPNPLPTTTNRHASIHDFRRAYSRENALIALMLSTSLLREWHEEGGEDGALASLAIASEQKSGATK